MENTNRTSYNAALSLPTRQFIEMPHSTEILNELGYILGRANAGEPTGLVISGATGTGKSSILSHFKASWDADLEKGECSPIALIKTPSKPSDKMLLENELTALGDPSPRSRDLSSKRDRRDALIETTNIKVLIYDDFQHIVEHRGEKVARQLLDELKNLSEQFGISLVFSGVNTVEQVGVINEQIDSRFSSLKRVRVMSIENDEEFNYFQSFIKAMATTKGITDVDLTKDNYIYRFYYAIKGDLRILNNLINKALYVFKLSKNTKLQLNHFETAFNDINSRTWENANDKRVNPFDPKKLNTVKKQLGIKG